jgi:hypothetical protein
MSLFERDETCATNSCKKEKVGESYKHEKLKELLYSVIITSDWFGACKASLGKQLAVT